MREKYILNSNRPANFKDIAKRICFGLVIGAFIGILELWFFEFSLRHGIAAILSGAVFGSILGIFAPFMFRKIWSTILLGAISGALAGVIWWIVVKPDVNIMISVIVGIALACLMVGVERPWKSI
jgi:heme O synthase-like polyprenyltransferase